MKTGEMALLASNKKTYLIEAGRGKLHTDEGVVDLNQLLKKKFGDEIKTHIGKKLVILKPNLNDILKKKMKRLPQIVTQKDFGLILANTAIDQGSLVVDAGTGSAFLAIMLANYVKPGKVVTYEKDKNFLKVCKWNIKNSGLPKYIRLKNKDIRKGIDERNVDLVTLDMKYAEEVVRHAYRALKPGGWLVVYSPYIEQVKAVLKEIERRNFFHVKTIESIVREWQVREHTLPMRSGLMHTGFLTFARKVH